MSCYIYIYIYTHTLGVGTVFGGSVPHVFWCTVCCQCEEASRMRVRVKVEGEQKGRKRDERCASFFTFSSLKSGHCGCMEEKETILMM